MVEAGPAVALLFDEPSLGEQLRSALQERGARIVHEGPLAGLSRELLSQVAADVLVVNLDDEDDDALDRLDETLDGDRPRVVFNDGQASRRLEGWDRARWARHLAMKVLAMGDADPPRFAVGLDQPQIIGIGVRRQQRAALQIFAGLLQRLIRQAARLGDRAQHFDFVDPFRVDQLIAIVEADVAGETDFHRHRIEIGDLPPGHRHLPDLLGQALCQRRTTRLVEQHRHALQHVQIEQHADLEPRLFFQQ